MTTQIAFPDAINTALYKTSLYSTHGHFEKVVFEDNYQEFLLQSQAYNRENNFRSFDELKTNNPKSNSLHYKVGFSVGLYIRSLQNKISIPPGIGRSDKTSIRTIRI